MAQTKYANFNSANIEENLAFELYEGPDATTFLGQWEFGSRPTGAPRYIVSDDADMRVKQDASEANALLMSMPATCYDVFTAARASNVFVLKKVQDLTGKGYRLEALAEKLAPLVTKQANELNILAGQLWSVKLSMDKAQEVSETTFPDTNENPAQSVAFDVAIVQKLT